MPLPPILAFGARITVARRNPLRAALCALLGFGLVAALILSDTAVANAKPAPGTVRILAPQEGALIGKPKIEVRLRTGADVKSIRVTNGTRRIAPGRFKRHPGGLRSASLRFATGYHRIAVRAKLADGSSRFEITHFEVGKYRSGLLKLNRVKGHGAANFSLRSRRVIEGLRVTLNGRKLPKAFDRTGSRTGTAELGGHHGLRSGRNVLTVRAHLGNGVFAVRRHRFFMSRSRPIAGAGPDRHAEVGRAVRLDGSSSRFTKARGPLVRRWKLVSRPAGSIAALGPAGQVRPRLRADLPGTYRVKLTVRARLRSGGKMTPLSSDTATVKAKPPTPPIGLPVQTISVSGAAGIRIGDTLYPAGGPSDKLCPEVAGSNAGWVQVLVLDRETTKCEKQYNFAATDDPQKLSDAVNSSDAGNMVIVTGGARKQPSLSQKQIDALSYTYKTLGGTLRPFLTRSNRGFDEGRWSLIGSKSVGGAGVEGSASQNQDFFSSGTGAGENYGSLDGYMQTNSEGNYAFVAGRFVPFDTDAEPREAGRNRIKVGDSTYRSGEGGQPVLTAGQAGFQLLILDQGSLKLLNNETFVTNETNGSQRVHGTASLMAMVDRLNQYADNQQPVLVILASIGKPAGAHSEWPGNFAAAVARLGGTRDLVAGLDKDSYTLVGGSRLPVFDTRNDSKLHLGSSGFGDEASSQLSPKLGARMAGYLVPNRQSQMTASAWNSKPGAFDMSALELAYNTTPVPWPDSDAAGEKAALAFITRKLSARLGLAVPGDIRASYVADTTASNWTNRRDDLSQINYPQTRAPGFTPAEFQALKSQLDTEFEYVAAVRAAIDRYQSIFTTDQIKGQVDLEAIAHQIETSIDPPKKKHTSFDMEAITDGILHFAESASDAIPGLEAAAPGFGMMEAVGEIANSSATVGGVPITVQIQDEEQKLAEQVTDVYAARQVGLEKAGDILVSDWARLQVAGPKSATDWRIDTEVMTVIGKVTTATSSQEFYGAITPLAFKVYGLGPESGTDPGITNARQYQCISGTGNMINIFRDAIDQGQHPVTSGWHDSSGKRIVWPHVLTGDIYDGVLDYNGRAMNGKPKYVSSGTLKDMFTLPQNGGTVGLSQVTFFEQNMSYSDLRCKQSR